MCVCVCVCVCVNVRTCVCVCMCTCVHLPWVVWLPPGQSQPLQHVCGCFWVFQQTSSFSCIMYKQVLKKTLNSLLCKLCYITTSFLLHRDTRFIYCTNTPLLPTDSPVHTLSDERVPRVHSDQHSFGVVLQPGEDLRLLPERVTTLYVEFEEHLK